MSRFQAPSQNSLTMTCPSIVHSRSDPPSPICVRCRGRIEHESTGQQKPYFSKEQIIVTSARRIFVLDRGGLRTSGLPTILYSHIPRRLYITPKVPPREGTRPTTSCRPGPLTRRRGFMSS